MQYILWEQQNIVISILTLWENDAGKDGLSEK